MSLLKLPFTVRHMVAAVCLLETIGMLSASRPYACLMCFTLCLRIQSYGSRVRLAASVILLKVKASERRYDFSQVCGHQGGHEKATVTHTHTHTPNLSQTHTGMVAHTLGCWTAARLRYRLLS